MRFVTYLSPSTGRPAPGVLSGAEVHGGPGERLIDVIAGGRAEASHWGQEALRNPVETVALDTANLLAPIPVPPSVRDFMAFEEHAVTAMASLGGDIDPFWYEAPVFYFSNPAAICAADQDVAMAPGGNAFDFEVEIAAVVGLAGSDLTVEEAGAHIAGYTILVDWSARDLQAAEVRVGLGPSKGKDTATTLGPYLVTPDELESFHKDRGFDCEVYVSVNGRQYTAGNWADIYWSFEQMVSYASRGTEVRPGDVIGSGTVGNGCILELAVADLAQGSYPYLKAGDEVVVAVEHLGVAISSIKRGASVHPLQHQHAAPES